MPAQPVRLDQPIGRDFGAGWESLFLKGNHSSPRTIAGLAANADVFDATVLPPANCTLSLPIPLFLEHQREIGEIIFLRRSPNGIFIRGRLYQSADDVWDQVYAGRLVGLSCSATGLSVDQGGVTVYRSWGIKEISLCAQPRNTACRLTIGA